MRVRSLVAGMLLTMFAGSAHTQEPAVGPSWRLGASWRILSGNALGLVMERDLRRDRLSLRAEASLQAHVRDPTELAATSAPIDARTTRGFASAGLAAELGPRSPRGDRSWFLLAGAGYGATRFGQGTIYAGWGGPEIDPEGERSVAPLTSYGFGWEFPLFGRRQRFELHVERFHDRTKLLDGGSFSFTRALGR
jgi:hypothetical protein